MVDVLATVPLSNKADLIFLLELVAKHTAILFIIPSEGNPGSSGPEQILKTPKILKFHDCPIDCCFAELQFFLNLPF